MLLDLSQLEFISAAASVLFLSTVQRARYYGPNSNGRLNVVVIEPKDPVIKGLLSSTGLLAALSCFRDKDFEQLFLTGSNYLTGNIPKKDAKRLSEHICKKYKLDKLPNRLSTAIDEGLLNVLHHAYSDKTHSFMKSRWWACAQVVEDENKRKHLQCIILDRGVGVASSIAKGYPDKLNMNLDSAAIQFAMQEGVTSTGKDGRGLGSEDMKHPIELSCENDFLCIYSHKGEVKFDKQNVTVLQHLDTVSSTIIEWSLEFDD
ncbi:hypothetical protein CWB79_20245 [Pseudoalteromonas sp. S1649]|nr:hypothetical protein CWB80_00165 [Pseudoalteromonas sp. S1650]TMP64550.1 hypothetical protein CWB79_20245 [Pseudoalteromonas sp. S1649]